MAHPVPAQAFLWPSPEAAMLFTLFGCIHPPPPAPHFLVPKVISRAQSLPTSIEVM